MNLSNKNYIYYEDRNIKCLSLTGAAASEPQIFEMGYGRARSEKRYVILRSYYLLQFVTKGKGRLGGEPFKSGDMILIRPDQLEIREPDPDDPYECAWIMAKGYVASRLLKDLYPDDGKSVISSKNAVGAAEMIKKTVDAAWADRALSAEYSMLSVFYYLLSVLSLKKEDKGTDPVALAMSYIELQYDNEALKIKDIALFSGVTQNHLCKLFKAKIGKSIQETLIDIRLSKAAVLLKSTACHIKDISSSVGFADQKHFSQMFKRKYNMTPKEYRIK